VDILEQALQREQDSEAYYRQLAASCPHDGLQTILLRLAEAEVRHQQVVRQMKEETGARLGADPFLMEVKGVFAQIHDRGSKIDPSITQVELYQKAQGFEKESWDLYLRAAAAAKSADARTVLQRLAGQEQMHHRILGTIIELVTRPLLGNWLENAEWYHADEY
jgi:rubrerythrin